MIFPTYPEYVLSGALGLTGTQPRRHKVFISYHHANDQWAKDELTAYGRASNDFIEKSVKEGDIDEDNSDQTIRRIIREQYLRDSTVTIVLIGEETRKRKYVDWEIYSSMRQKGSENTKNGIACILLPGTSGWEYYPNGWEAERVLGVGTSPLNSQKELEEAIARHGTNYLGERLTENLMKGEIWVLQWERIRKEGVLNWLIDQAFQNRLKAEYNFSRPMMGRNRPRSAAPSVLLGGSINPYIRKPW